MDLLTLVRLTQSWTYEISQDILSQVQNPECFDVVELLFWPYRWCQNTKIGG